MVVLLSIKGYPIIYDYEYEIELTAQFVVSPCALANFEYVFLFLQSFECGWG